MVLFIGDSSSNNEPGVNWKEASSVLDGGMIKVTQGSDYVNPYWQAEQEQMEELLDSTDGEWIPGAYLFADGTDPRKQAQFFREHAGPLEGWMLVTDTERNPLGPSVSMGQAHDLVRELRRLYPHHKMGGYPPHWYTGGARLAFFDWIIASSYVEGSGTAAELYSRVPESWWAGYGGKNPVMLQFSPSVTLPGFPGPADCSAFRGGIQDLARLAEGTGGAWRRVAKGQWSLDQTAFLRNTTAAFLIGISEEMLAGERLEKFRDYVAGGTHKVMPAGLVYYTEHRGGRAG